jgi:NAD+ kinase
MNFKPMASKTVWLRIKQESPRKKDLESLFAEAFLKFGFKTICSDEMPDGPLGLVVGLGGDGSQLSTLRRMDKRRYDVPFLGLHLSTGLGFLPPFSVPNENTKAADLFLEIAQCLDQSRYTVEERWGLQTDYDNQSHWALNDFVFSKGPLSRMIQLKVLVGDETLLPKMRGDGLIVSTSTGSTAYSLSAGGPVVHPSLNVLILTPICPHEVSQRPLVLDGHQKLSIQVLKTAPTTVFLTFDGQSQIEIKPGAQIQVTRSERPVSWLVPQTQNAKPRSFIAQLRSKLGYGGKDLGEPS